MDVKLDVTKMSEKREMERYVTKIVNGMAQFCQQCAEWCAETLEKKLAQNLLMLKQAG